MAFFRWNTFVDKVSWNCIPFFNDNTLFGAKYNYSKDWPLGYKPRAVWYEAEEAAFNLINVNFASETILLATDA